MATIKLLSSRSGLNKGIPFSQKTGNVIAVDSAEAERMIAKGQAVLFVVATPLPDTFPAYKQLLTGGYSTVESVSNLSSDELISITGIGEKTAKAIQKSL